MNIEGKMPHLAQTVNKIATLNIWLNRSGCTLNLLFMQNLLIIFEVRQDLMSNGWNYSVTVTITN